MSISDVPRLQERLMMSLYKLIYSSPFFRRLIREMVDDADQTVHFLTALFPSCSFFFVAFDGNSSLFGSVVGSEEERERAHHLVLVWSSTPDPITGERIHPLFFYFFIIFVLFSRRTNTFKIAVRERTTTLFACSTLACFVRAHNKEEIEVRLLFSFLQKIQFYIQR